MCWITKKKEYIERRVADSDIHVFKICYRYIDDKTDWYESAYYNYVYEIGRHYRQELGIPDLNEFDNDYIIDEGFHSYDASSVRIGLSGCDHIQVILKSRFGGIFKNSSIRTVVRLNCIIPKGASYYVNEEGEYVSSELIVKSASNVLI
jgi:hypothetical protein